MAKGFPQEEKFVWTAHDAVMITMTIGISGMQLPQTIKPLRGVLGTLCALRCPGAWPLTTDRTEFSENPSRSRDHHVSAPDSKGGLGNPTKEEEEERLLRRPQKTCDGRMDTS